MPATSLTPELDPDLLRRAQASDEAAFGIMMRTHYEPTFRLVCANREYPWMNKSLPSVSLCLCG